jgi:uncharacterized protein
MLEHGPARRLTIYIGESDQFHHHPVYAEIIKRARERGLSGASVFRGIEGFGRTSHLHTTRLLSLSEDLPVKIEIIDSSDRVEGFLPDLDELVSGGLVTLEDIEVLRYVGTERDA